MTDVKVLVEKINANRANVFEIDWVEETNQFQADRLRELIFAVPHAHYELMKDVIIAEYMKAANSVSGGLLVPDKNKIDQNRYEYIFTYYQEAPIIDNVFYYTYEERLHAENVYAEDIKKINQKYFGEENTDSNEPTDYEIKSLRNENAKLLSDIEKLKAENKTITEERDELAQALNAESYGFNFGLQQLSWSVICKAMSFYAQNLTTSDKKKYSVNQLSFALAKLTGFSSNTIRGKVHEEKHNEEAKEFLQKLIRKI